MSKCTEVHIHAGNCMNTVTLLKLDDGITIELTPEQAERVGNDYVGDHCTVINALKNGDEYYKAEKIEV